MDGGSNGMEELHVKVVGYGGTSLNWAIYPHKFSYYKVGRYGGTLMDGGPLFQKNGPTPASFLFISVFSNKQYNFYNKSMWKNVKSIQYMALGFEPMTSRTWVVSHNHLTKASALWRFKFLYPSFYLSQNRVSLLRSLHFVRITVFEPWT